MRSLISTLLFSVAVMAQTHVPDIEPADTTLVDLSDYSRDFLFDMKYATAENFLKEAVYDCGECHLRYKTVKALLKAQSIAAKRGLRIQIFDCYRPLSVQRKMWKIVDDPAYVADPAKGSIHNRGGALDLTLTDADGIPLDMGTGFDHFGPEAAHAYDDLSEEVLENRRLLRRIMRKAGFSALESEWWHYNLKGARHFPLSDQGWDCD